MTRSAPAIYGPANQGDALAQLLGLSNVQLSNGVVVTVGNQGPISVDDWSGLSGFKEAEFYLNVTAAATEVGDLLDVFIDCSNDDGATFVNIVHFTQLLGNGGAKKEVAFCLRTAAQLVAGTADLASGATPRPFFGDRCRLRWQSSGDANANAAFTFKVTASFK